jgi:hypothetical protein
MRFQAFRGSVNTWLRDSRRSRDANSQRFLNKSLSLRFSIRLLQCSIDSILRPFRSSRSHWQRAIPSPGGASDLVTIMQPAAMHQSGEQAEESATVVNSARKKAPERERRGLPCWRSDQADTAAMALDT